MNDSRLLQMSSYLVDYPVADRLYAGAVDGRVLIYIHKEQMLGDVEQRYPARPYVMVDDKLRILAAMKNVWGNRLTTVFPRQRHYALNAHNIAAYPAADHTVERIGDLMDCDLRAFLGVDVGRTELVSDR